MKTIQRPKHEQLRTTEKIVEQGKVVKMGEGKFKESKSCFSKIYHFWKNLILQTIYSFYQNKFGLMRYAFK